MAYTALYRRFRPITFGDLVGQQHISATLSNAVRRNNVTHAYLFCGPRGTGKTSTAKILARAVNCLNPCPDGDPCGECEACKRILNGETLDILEIDAASNRGIDEIRDLRERVKYSPAQEKYKVYIIDEVHMLTGDAFNALLKTLEEPPSHVIFILATTEPHSIPLTVLSRCQRFDFHRIALADIISRLKEIARSENLKVDEDALILIARKSEGGLRDAVNLLDQCGAFSADRITVKTIEAVLGMVDADFIAAMARAMAQGDLPTVLGAVEELSASGFDLRQFLHDLAAYLRTLLLERISADQSKVPAWVRQLPAERLLSILQTLGDTDNRLRYSLQPRITLELALIQATGMPKEANQVEPKKIAQNEDVIAKPILPKKKEPLKAEAILPEETKKVLASDMLQSAKLDKNVDGLPKEQKRQRPEVACDPAPAVVQEKAVQPEAQQEKPTGLTVDLVLAQWPQIMKEIQKANMSTFAFLELAKPVSLQGKKLVLEFPAGSDLYLKTICTKPKHKNLVEEILHKHFPVALLVDGFLSLTPLPPQQEETPEPEHPDEQYSLFDQ